MRLFAGIFLAVFAGQTTAVLADKIAIIAQYEGWSVVCQNLEQVKRCYADQAIVDLENRRENRYVLRISMRYSPKRPIGKAEAWIDIPFRSLLNGKVSFAVDRKTFVWPVSASCARQSCVLLMGMDKKIINMVRRGKMASLFIIPERRPDHAERYYIPLAGVSQALDHARKLEAE